MAGFADIIRIVNRLGDGVKITKAKVDGKTVEVLSGQVKGDTSEIKITLSYKDQTTFNVESTHAWRGRADVIKIDDVAVDEADIDVLAPVVNIASVSVKIILEYKQGGTPHEITLYCKVAGL